MDLKRLRYFCSVVEQGTITRAAETLHMAQPPLSKRLQELEEEIGVPLLDRDGRQISPTAAGYYLYQRATNILREVDDTIRETVARAQNKSKLLRIGLSHLYQRHFSQLLLELHRSAPSLDITITVSDSGHLERLLSDGHIDIALIQKPNRAGGFDVIDLAPVRILGVASTRLDIPEGAEISLGDLGQWPLIMLRRNDGIGTYEVLLDHFRKSGVAPNLAMAISQPEVILEWLQSGLEAVALLPASEVTPEHLSECRILAIHNAPMVFFPSVVRRAATPFPKELAEAMRNLDLPRV